MLDELKSKARRDEKLRAELLETRKNAQPLSAFCRKCRELGYGIYDMDLITAGEEFYATMRRSTNGGGENSRCWRVRMIFMNCFCGIGVNYEHMHLWSFQCRAGADLL